MFKSVQKCSNFVQTSFRKEKQGLSGFVFKSVQCSEVFKLLDGRKIGVSRRRCAISRRREFLGLYRDGGVFKVGGCSACEIPAYFTSCLLKPSQSPLFLGVLGGRRL